MTATTLPPLSERELWEVAVHEAGHCTAAEALGVAVLRANLHRRRGARGEMFHGPCTPEQEAIVAAAGPVAVEYLCPKSTHDHWSGSDHSARIRALAGVPSGRLLDAWRRPLDRARQIVWQRRTAARRLARELVERRELDGPDILRLLRAAEAERQQKEKRRRDAECDAQAAFNEQFHRLMMDLYR